MRHSDRRAPRQGHAAVVGAADVKRAVGDDGEGQPACGAHLDDADARRRAVGQYGRFGAAKLSDVTNAVEYLGAAELLTQQVHGESLMFAGRRSDRPAGPR